MLKLDNLKIHFSVLDKETSQNITNYIILWIFIKPLLREEE